jgi:hypothetical protein
MRKREMLRVPRRESLALILVGLFSFSLIIIGTKASQLSFLALIGAWLVLGALVWHFYRLREEMRKKGHDILW